MTRARRHPAARPAGATAAAHDRGRDGRRPLVLVALCGLVLFQAGLAVGLAVAWAVDLVRGAVQVPAATVFLVLFALGVAVVLGLAVRGLWGGRRWARGPVMTWQVLLVVMAVGWLGYDAGPWAVAVLVSALVVAVGLLLPPVVAATVGRRDA